MSDKKISQLTASTTPLAGTEVLPIVQSGATTKVPVSDLTAGRVVSVSRITATGGVGTPSSNAQYGYTSTAGAVITGTGSNFDVQLQNKSNQNCLAIPTGTRDVSLAAGNLVIGTSGKGIDFSATPGTGTSELFADYEEGTWTPTLAYATPGTSVFTYGTQTGTYTKIGNVVTVSLTIILTAFVKGTASGSFRVAGLPYTSAASEFYNASLVLANQTFTGIPGARTSPGTTNLNLRQYSSAGAGSVMSDPSINSEFYITLVYQV